MTAVRVPTPLRPFTGGERELQIEADTVATALHNLTLAYPQLHQHVFDESNSLRSYVNIFVNDDDMRNLQGLETEVGRDDRITIVPSIAGGGKTPSMTRPTTSVDHSALRTNQAMIIGLLLAAFVVDSVALVAFVGLIMLLGSIAGRPGFSAIYAGLRRLGWLRADPVPDHPQPHRFAQTVGGVFLAAATAAHVLALAPLGWALVWVVIGLAGLNLFGGFCVGCAMYYWLTRLGIPGFHRSPPPGSSPGRRPPSEPVGA